MKKGVQRNLSYDIKDFLKKFFGSRLFVLAVLMIILSRRFCIVTSAGWPNLLFFPTPIIAYWGLTESKNSFVDDVLEPVMCYF